MSDFTIQAERTLGTATSILIRDHRVAVDRPKEKGGSDVGPMGGELLLAAVAGCFTSTLIAAAAAREQELGNVTCTVVGHLDGPPPHFESIEMKVASDTLDAEAFQHLVTVAERGCIVANTLKSTTKLEISTTPVAQ
jgi:putative redox protein